MSITRYRLLTSCALLAGVVVPSLSADEAAEIMQKVAEAYRTDWDQRLAMELTAELTDTGDVGEGQRGLHHVPRHQLGAIRPGLVVAVPAGLVAQIAHVELNDLRTAGADGPAPGPPHTFLERLPHIRREHIHRMTHELSHPVLCTEAGWRALRSAAWDRRAQPSSARPAPVQVQRRREDSCGRLRLRG